MNGRPDLTEQLQRLHRIGIALSSERSLDRLLEMIVEEARRLTGPTAARSISSPGTAWNSASSRRAPWACAWAARPGRPSRGRRCR